MVFRPFSAAAFFLFSACAAATPGNLSAAISACDRGARSVEMREAGTVQTVLGIRPGYSGSHEGFLIVFPERARAWRVEDNVSITGPIVLHRGDRVQLQGVFECNDGVIHWTHRDPRGRHPDGFISVHGTVYR